MFHLLKYEMGEAACRAGAVFLRGDDFSEAWLFKGRKIYKFPSDTGLLYFYPRFTLMMLLS